MTDLERIRALLPNQCAGCQAGWPISGTSLGDLYALAPWRAGLHVQPGNLRYRDSIVCTRAMYL